MRGILLAVAVLSFAGCASAESAKPASQAPMETDDQKTLYALGFALSNQLQGVEFEPGELTLIQRGLADGLSGNTAQVEMTTFGPKINAMMQSRITAAAEQEKSAGKAFCDAMESADGGKRTSSGAVYVELEAGDGAQPGPSDTVKLHYHGTLADGTVFDSSVEKGTPASFSVSGVVPCFSEGVREMQVGGKAKLCCPSDTAYGDRGRPPFIKPGAAIAFEVELLEVVDAD